MLLVGDPQQMPFLRGISDYARQQGSWVLQINPEMFSLGLRHLAADGARVDYDAATAGGRADGARAGA